jgi:ubiquinone biosynthesis accessory factor UbiJ
MKTNEGTSQATNTLSNGSFINKTSAAIIEQVANRILKLDVEAHDKLADFSDKIIHIQVEDLSLNYFFLFPGGSLIVQESCEKPVSASIRGKLSAFTSALMSPNSGDAIFTGELHFSGEMNTARRFQEFVQTLQIDWQEPMSKIIGDVMTHNISQGLGAFGNFVNQFISSVNQDIPEYMQHEIQVTPTQSELNNFFEQVDLTRSQAERLHARVQRLKLLQQKE